MRLNNPSLLREQCYVNGKWVAAEQSIRVENPYNQSIIGTVPNMEVALAEQAILAAHDAMQAWKNYTAGERAAILYRWYELQMAHLDDLATILTTEQGKPLKEAKGEVRYGASFVRWFAEEALRIYGDVIPGHGRDKRITVIKQPIGVVGAITPWNFPNAMITRKVAPALAAGCTVVIKPSELTPFSALALGVLAEEAGFPEGVINILTTKDPAPFGHLFAQHPLVKKISFTGSTRVGKILLKQAASQVKKVSLELGGNAPFIVFDDADIPAAVEGCIASKFRNGGQTCVCTNRIFVQRPVYDTFVIQLKAAMEKLELGDGLVEETDIGPLINEAAQLKCERLLADATGLGAVIVLGGERRPGRFFTPTLVSNATADMAIFREEIFGPVAVVYPFETEEEVLTMANDTEYGLASYFYGRDYARIWRIAEQLDYGMVGINTGMISTTVAPFGGIKQSGFGREGSKYGIDDFVNIKYMCWGGVA